MSRHDPENIANIDSPDDFPARPVGGIDSPDDLFARPIGGIDGPDRAISKVPSAASPPSAKTAKTASGVSIPAVKIATSKTAVTIPLTKMAQLNPLIGFPVIKTPQEKGAIIAPEEISNEFGDAIAPPLAADSTLPQTIPTPSARPAKSTKSAATPSLLTANPRALSLPPFPLNHARILYDNVMRRYDAIIDNTGTNTAVRALMYDTSKRWSFTQNGGTNAMRTDFNSPVNFDTVCIAGHNLSDVGATVSVIYDEPPSGGFITLASFTPTNNNPIMFHFDEQFVAETIQINIKDASGVVEIAYISAGVALQMQRPFFNGHVPITDGDVTQYYRAKTESGNIIGRSIRSQGYQTQYQWSNLSDEWYRSYFEPFKRAAKTTPFFIAWNLLEYPQDVGFGHTAGDIRAPMQNGFGVKRSVDFELLGY